MAPKARILAIDDQPYFRSLIEALLSEGGYSVRTTVGGSEALGILEQEGPFDLVILDPVMPVAEAGRQVGELRERWPEQDLIVLSAISDVRVVAETMKRGAADYLLKPVDRESLLQGVASVLQGHRRRAENAHVMDQNLELMGRLSLLERALPLHGLSHAADVGRGLLELLCIETQSPDGVLWLRETRGGALKRAAVRGSSAPEAQPENWPEQGENLQQQLASGRATQVEEAAASAQRAPLLLVPCVRDGQLLAVARLSGRSGPDRGPEESAYRASVIDACEKLAEIAGLAISKAYQLADLQQTSFRDASTGLPSRALLELVAKNEIHKASRYGRRLSCLAIALDGLPEKLAPRSLQALVDSIARTLRGADILAAENARSFWVLVTDTDSFGAVVMKRRVARCLQETLDAQGIEGSVALGLARYPIDGESVEELMRRAREHVEAERASVVREFGIQPQSCVAEVEKKLLAHATPMPPDFVPEAAGLLIGDLVCRSRDRGLLFLAPGSERGEFLGSLRTLCDGAFATEVFLATDGDTLPEGPRVTALALPPEVSPESTWIVRFGEAPPYVLVAGAPGADGYRPVYHSGDPVLVEDLTFRLRAETGIEARR